MKLNLGGALNPEDGYVNVDIVDGVGVDVVWDLTRHPWPWDDGAINEIRAFELVEHLPALVPFLDECWRVLQPGGRLIVRTANPLTENAWRDPTHVRPYTRESFYYFDPDSTWHKWGKLYTGKTWKVIAANTFRHDAFMVTMEPRK